eukprot:152094_1
MSACAGHFGEALHNFFRGYNIILSDDPYAASCIAIECLEKCVAITSTYPSSFDSTTRNVLLAHSKFWLSVLYLTSTNKWGKAKQLHDDVNPQYVEDIHNYFKWRIQLNFFFNYFDAMSNALYEYSQLNVANNNLWYYTAKMKYYLMMNKYTEATIWYKIASTNMNKLCYPALDLLEFEIWNIYRMLCEGKYIISSIWDISCEEITSVPLIYAIVYIVLKLNETGIDKEFEDALWYFLSFKTYAFVEYHVAIQLYKCEMYILSKKKMRKAIKRTSELQIIERNGKQWLKEMKNVCDNLWCDYCGIKNNTKGIRLMTCIQCMKAKYCSRHCQKKGWKYEHKFKCKFSCVTY